MLKKLHYWQSMASLNVAQMDIIIIAIADMHDNHKLTITHHNHFPAFFHQAIAESGSALSGWAFDSKPELHGKVIDRCIFLSVELLIDIKHCHHEH